jgi:Flp pilus assembly protein TadG
MLERLRTLGGVGARRARIFFSRFAHDARGNTLIIVAASILPLLAMIGSGIDMSRAYMAQARLQQACDAASLAGRRVMTGTAIDSTVTNEVTKFFNFNFPQKSFQTASFTPVVTAGANQTVIISAATTIPTSIMKIFGFSTLPLSVTCNAKQDFVNTDIVLVLDTTGSMLDDVNNNHVNGGSTSKIVGLRSAVMALYDQLSPVQTQLQAAGLRLRYGVVPYSSMVNVGKLITTMSPSYMNDSSTYQTRVANYNQPVYIGTPGAAVNANETFGSAITSANCTKYSANTSFTQSSPSASFSPNPSGSPLNSGTAPANTTTTTYTNTSWTKTSGSGTSAVGTCVRNKSVVTTTYITRYKASSSSAWIYQANAIDTSQFKTGAAVAYATNTGGTVATSGTYDPVYIAANADSEGNPPALTTATATWNGCIEELSTTSSINSSSGLTIPSNAYDLNINYVPSGSTGPHWTTAWPEMEYYRKSSSFSSGTYQNQPMMNQGVAYYACPAPASRLQAWTRDDMQTYVNALSPVGGTYHDIGMAWGARLLSQTGIFGSDNPTTYPANGMPVSRYIIFLTDGLMAPNGDSYNAWGIEYMDQRVTGSSTYNNTTDHDDHVQRFEMICNAAKSEGVSIWVIAFASALDTSLTQCASNASQASTSNSQQDLINQFTLIGKNIGALRLTQ